MNELPLNQILCGDCREVMAEFPADSIDLVVTSPPYWGLRDYGLGEGQLGLEPHPQLFIDHLVEICREIRRVLKPSGTFWLNLGDTYYSSPSNQHSDFVSARGSKNEPRRHRKLRTKWLQPKQLLMIPSRVAIALQHDGWLLRNDIIWHKPNHMPSSVKDRLTCAYEHVFLFVKARHYYFDLDAIRKPHSASTIQRITQPNVMKQLGGDKQRELRGEGGGNASRSADMVKSLARNYENLTKHDIAVGRIGNFSYTDPLHTKEYHPKGKNPGDLWRIPTKPFPGAHFATFPPKLIEPIIKAGCPRWICSQCRKPRIRISEPTQEYSKKLGKSVHDHKDDLKRGMRYDKVCNAEYVTVGWSDCGCGADYVGGVVLDPFAGSGTALRVARKLGRRFIGIEISPEYAEMARQRVRSDKYKEPPEGVPTLTEAFEDVH